MINMKPHQFVASDPLLWRLQRPHGGQAKAALRFHGLGVLEFSGVLWTREG